MSTSDSNSATENTKWQISLMMTSETVKWRPDEFHGKIASRSCENVEGRSMPSGKVLNTSFGGDFREEHSRNQASDLHWTGMKQS